MKEWLANDQMIDHPGLTHIRYSVIIHRKVCDHSEGMNKLQSDNTLSTAELAHSEKSDRRLLLFPMSETVPSLDKGG